MLCDFVRVNGGLGEFRVMVCALSGDYSSLALSVPSMGNA